MPQLSIGGIDHRYTIEGADGAPVVTFGHAQGFKWLFPALTPR